MPIYSHSQLSTYDECPLKYKLCYRDRIKRGRENVESFLGTMVHETLKKCYDDIRFTRLDSLDELLGYYHYIWHKNWHDAIVIMKKDLTQEHYRSLGDRMIETYYHRYAPFKADITIGTEMRLRFSLDDCNGKYQFTGFIDRLSKTGDGACCIHDYKTSAYLPSQEDADNDRQLALYQLGVQKKWPDIETVQLIWHYLAFDRELVSTRSEQSITRLVADMTHLIDEIEAAEDFPPKDSGLCEWCEYPDLCPMRKHFYTVETLPPNEYLTEPGVALVNRYAELKDRAAEIDEELADVKEALISYAIREGVSMIKGSNLKARIKVDKKLKFPGKNDGQRQELDNAIRRAGKWMEVSQLDTTMLNRIIESASWNKELVDEVLKYGRIEEASSVYLSKLKDEE